MGRTTLHLLVMHNLLHLVVPCGMHKQYSPFVITFFKRLCKRKDHLLIAARQAVRSKNTTKLVSQADEVALRYAPNLHSDSLIFLLKACCCWQPCDDAKAKMPINWPPHLAQLLSQTGVSVSTCPRHHIAVISGVFVSRDSTVVGKAAEMAQEPYASHGKDLVA